MLRCLLQELLKDITEREIFGRVKAWCYSVEFQKRGMPHIHMLITLWDNPEGQPTKFTADWIDNFICAELPQMPHESDKSPQAQLQRDYVISVRRHQVHDCLAPRANCKTINNGCHKRFPKVFSKHTLLDGGLYTTYRRRTVADGGEAWEVNPDTPQARLFTNEHVAAFSPFLTKKYDCHNNLEFLQSENCLLYVFKYIMKGNTSNDLFPITLYALGHDMAYVRLEKNGEPTGVVDYDEIQSHFKAR